MRYSDLGEATIIASRREDLITLRDFGVLKVTIDDRSLDAALVDGLRPVVDSLINQRIALCDLQLAALDIEVV